MDAFTYRITKAIAGGMNLLAATACGQESSSYVHRAGEGLKKDLERNIM